LIKSPKVLELLMMSEDSYVHDPCLCLKSTWLADATEGAERTVDCYDYRKWLIVPHTIKNLEGKEKLMKIRRDAEFTVGNTGGKTKVYLKPATQVPDKNKLCAALKFFRWFAKGIVVDDGVRSLV
ncbi:hypothetical protein MTO96_039182, partial [Rhipicephalus appendiculatus]